MFNKRRGNYYDHFCNNGQSFCYRISLLFTWQICCNLMGEEKSNIADQSIVNTSSSSHVVFPFHVAQNT